MQSLMSSSTADETDVKLPLDLCLPLIGFEDFLHDSII